MSTDGWGGHAWYECEKGCNGCMFCNGGLASCTRCGGFEGSLPSECPGEKMTEEQETAIYAGALDFRAGTWVNKPSGGVSSHYDGRPGLPEEEGR
jgi:hypothetical protein